MKNFYTNRNFFNQAIMKIFSISIDLTKIFLMEGNSCTRDQEAKKIICLNKTPNNNPVKKKLLDYISKNCVDDKSVLESHFSR